VSITVCFVALLTQVFAPLDRHLTVRQAEEFKPLTRWEAAEA
jgi:hypothetical protein